MIPGIVCLIECVSRHTVPPTPRPVTATGVIHLETHHTGPPPAPYTRVVSSPRAAIKDVGPGQAPKVSLTLNPRRVRPRTSDGSLRNATKSVSLIWQILCLNSPFHYMLIHPPPPQYRFYTHIIGSTTTLSQ